MVAMKYEIGTHVIDEDDCAGIVCIRYADGDICFIENDAAHLNPTIDERPRCSACGRLMADGGHSGCCEWMPF